MNAVIDEKSFDKITKYIDRAQQDDSTEIIFGGKYNKEKGNFIGSTVTRPRSLIMSHLHEELFGPVLTVYIYEVDELDRILKTIDTTSPYVLNVSLFA